MLGQKKKGPEHSLQFLFPIALFHKLIFIDTGDECDSSLFKVNSGAINITRGEVSMTQSGDPLENAIAERSNGILKVEWLYKMTLSSRSECKDVLERIIPFYNSERPHMSIGWQTPEQAHTQYGEQRRVWKNYYYHPEQKLEDNQADESALRNATTEEVMAM